MTDRSPVATPETAFENPAAVLRASQLSQADKQKTLESWAFLVRSRLDAVSEGMNSHEGGRYADDVDLIREIEKALASIATPSDQEPPLTRRTGAAGLAR